MSLRLSISKNPIKARENRPEKVMKKKIFFVFEGEITEKIYFEKIKVIIENSNEPQIPELLIFDRILKHKSNQLYITKNIENFLHKAHNLKEENYFDELYNIIEKFKQDDDFSYENLKEFLKTRFEGSPEIVESISNSDKVFEITDQIDALNDFSTYKQGFDKVCIIIDRDQYSFNEKQLETVIDICKKNNFLLGLTNPCFEFYLLLHLSDIPKSKHMEINENSKVTSKKTFVESYLNDKYKSFKNGIAYKKNNYDVDLFLSNLDFLYENHKKFQISVDNADKNIGSSIPIMLEELKIKDTIIDYYKNKLIE